MDQQKWIVFGLAANGMGTTLTHATDDLKTTFCGRTITAEWYVDDWADGPECKRCRKIDEQKGGETR